MPTDPARLLDLTAMRQDAQALLDSLSEYFGHDEALLTPLIEAAELGTPLVYSEHAEVQALAQKLGLTRLAAQVVALVDLVNRERLGRVRRYQDRVQQWCVSCFGDTTAADVRERSHRFLEEALELAQSLGCTRDEAAALLEYVYSRPVGVPAQELGGVMVTTAALAAANGLDMQAAGELELSRVWTKLDAIRAKHATKPLASPLPGTPQENDHD